MVSDAATLEVGGETPIYGPAEPFSRWAIDSALPIPGLHVQSFRIHHGRIRNVAGAMSAACGSPTGCRLREGPNDEWRFISRLSSKKVLGDGSGVNWPDPVPRSRA
ncbi:hypothetical protein CCR75_004461 [Bremia lactucae]|uniref:Uncharacterized protein n=1 Tax=Bremia lactucae TaxID=4779 RepID=A0A976NXV1_BRELC|nr:hypothetical protein CCR75_004461 [Bremia lactucae]